MNGNFNEQVTAKILLAHSDTDVRAELSVGLRKTGYSVITNDDPVELNRIVGYIDRGLLSFDLCIWDQRLISSELLSATERQRLSSAFPFVVLFLHAQTAAQEIRKRLNPAAVLHLSQHTNEQLAVIENILPLKKTSSAPR